MIRLRSGSLHLPCKLPARRTARIIFVVGEWYRLLKLLRSPSGTNHAQAVAKGLAGCDLAVGVGLRKGWGAEWLVARLDGTGEDRTPLCHVGRILLDAVRQWRDLPDMPGSVETYHTLNAEYAVLEAL